MLKCSKCNKECKILTKNCCNSCYGKFHRPKKICSCCKQLNTVGKNVNKKPVCKSCYSKHLQIKKECHVCKINKRVYKYDNSSPICQNCYKNKYKEICVKCNQLKKCTLKGPMCDSCYVKYCQKEQKCTSCGKYKKTKCNCENGPVCERCYKKYKKQNNNSFYLKELLGNRLRIAFLNYSKTGKIKTADEYGINYQAIVEHLGKCPGKRGEYHMDHIIPISAFDFDNLTHVKAAFAPENHQWLKAKDNRKKGAKHDRKDFENYMKNFEENKNG